MNRFSLRNLHAVVEPHESVDLQEYRGNVWGADAMRLGRRRCCNPSIRMTRIEPNPSDARVASMRLDTVASRVRATMMLFWLILLIGAAATSAWADERSSSDAAMPPLRLAPRTTEQDNKHPQTATAPIWDDAALMELPPPQTEMLGGERHAAEVRDPRWYAQRVGIGLVIFGALVLVHRILGGAQRVTLPRGAIEVCGKVPFDAKRSLHLVRVGSRLLVLLESAQGIQRLAEITDPGEVQRLLCANPEEVQRRGQWFPQADDLEDGTPSVAQVLAEFRDRERSGAGQSGAVHAFR